VEIIMGFIMQIIEPSLGGYAGLKMGGLKSGSPICCALVIPVTNNKSKIFFS